MPFQKGNTIWKEGVAVKKEKTLKMDQFLMILGNGGMVRYADIMDKIAKGEEPTKAEVEFMDRCEGWREYIKPKLARTELTGKDGKDLIPEPTDSQKKELVKQWTQSKSTQQGEVT